jgi:hydroxyacylglutathione hydrolase
MTRSDAAPMSFVDAGLGNSSYLLDVGDGRALVIDPTRDVTQYRAAAHPIGWPE